MRTTTDSECRWKHEVVQITYSTVGRWLIDDQTTSLQLVGKLVDTILSLICGMDRCSVALTSEVNSFRSNLNSLIEILGFEETEYRAKFLETHRILVADLSVVSLANKYLTRVILGDLETSTFTDRPGGCTNSLWIHLAYTLWIKW